jgi:carbamoyl-phosphate synthase large subunit
VTVVLFTCAGQRVDIVTAFREAGATTIAVDVDQLAPALYHADRRALVPRVDDLGYVPALRDLVELHDVRLIVPLTDLDHHALADGRDDLGGSLVLVSGIETVARCSDKYLAHQFFEEHGIGSPPTWLPTALPDELRYPVLM